MNSLASFTLHFGLLPIILLAFGCGTREVVPVPPPSSESRYSQILDKLVDLNKLVHRNDKVGFCSDLQDLSCDDGDSTIRNGQLCFSGSLEYCQYVKLAIGTDGRIFRSPLRVDISSTEDNSSSRDQLLGVLLYLVKTHDVVTATKILEYIDAHDGKMCEGDNRCKVSNLGHIGGMWGVMKQVWNHLGLPPNNQMKLSNLGDETTMIVSAENVPVGYRLHLLAMEVLLYRHCDKNTDKLNDVTRLIHQRDPFNPLYSFMMGLDIAEEFLIKAPTSTGLRLHWGLQVDMSLYNKEQDNVGSWIMLGNLLLGKSID